VTESEEKDMFLHVFTNRFKCLLHNRQLIFWTLLYPLVLGTFFSLAFSNMGSDDAFTSIPVAVVNTAEYQSDVAFQSALKSVSESEGEESPLLFVTMTEDEKHADALLDAGTVKGYILMQDGARVVFNDSGISQTIIKSFMDSYLQTESAFMRLAQENPAALANVQYDGEANYVKAVSPGRADPDSWLIYYYSLIAMMSMFGGFWGIQEITDIQANLSPCGARVNVAPTHKLKMLAYSFPAAITIQFLSALVLVAYLYAVLGVSFGSQLLYVLIACLAGSITGVTYGAMIGAVVKGGEGIKTAVLLVTSLVLSFLAGLMVTDVKYAVVQAVPAMAYLNPANLISDAFYALYYYSSYTRFFENVGLLLGFSAVFTLIVYLKTRRQRYASL
jgi:ABC-2 type transport system permease protein